MKSGEWLFPYTTAAVLSAAEAKRNFHLGRLEFWQKKKTETMERIRSEGLEVRDSLAGAAYSNAARGAQIVIDSTLQSDLDECAHKIREHDSKAKTYGGWVSVLEAQRGDVTLQLDHEDFLFFFGK